MNPLENGALFTREEEYRERKPLTLDDRDKVLIFQGCSNSGKTLLARRAAGQAYMNGNRIMAVSDKPQSAAEYIGERVETAWIRHGDGDMSSLLEHLPKLNRESGTLYVFDALDSLLTDDIGLPDGDGIAVFSSFMNDVMESDGSAVIAVTERLDISDRLSFDGSLDVTLSRGPEPRFHATVDGRHGHMTYLPEYRHGMLTPFDWGCGEWVL